MVDRVSQAIVTPEAVALDLRVAGLGSRTAAAALDGLIQLIALGIGVAAAVSLADLVPNQAAAITLSIAGVLLIMVGYYLLFEGLWEGQTPGKRMVGLRVVTDLGQPVTWRHVIIRTLFRMIDMIPVVGPLAILLTARSQRLGDLAAGTIVVMRASRVEPMTLDFGPSRRRDEFAQTLDTTGLKDRDYALVRSFLLRRAALTPEARANLAAQIADKLEQEAGVGSGDLDDELFLEAVVVSRSNA